MIQWLREWWVSFRFAVNVHVREVARLIKRQRPLPKSPQEMGKVWKDGEDVVPPQRGQKPLCPNCHGDKFWHGPEGGMSVNICCADCHHKWNATFIEGFSWQFIGYGPLYNELRVAVNVARRN